MAEKKWNGLPIIIFGIGGAARDVVVLIEDINSHSKTPQFDIVGFVSHESSLVGNEMSGYPIIASNDDFISFSQKFPTLGVVIGLGDPKVKENIYEKLLKNEEKFVFPNLIHPTANICSPKHSEFGYGIMLCAGVTAAYGVKLGNFVTYNLNATIGHDSITGDFCSVNPQAVVSGNVIIGKCSLVGAGASIREKISIGERATIGMGAVVVKDVPKGAIMIGKAAKKMEE